jgi:hypothetical protein
MQEEEKKDFTLDIHVYDSREERKLRIERVRLEEGARTPVGTLYKACRPEASVESALTLPQVRAALAYRKSISDLGIGSEVPMWAARLPAESRYRSTRIQLFANDTKISRYNLRPLSEFAATTTFRVEIDSPRKDAIIFGLHSTLSCENENDCIDWIFCDRVAKVEATLGSKIVGHLFHPGESVAAFMARIGIEQFGLLDTQRPMF